jgi:hypothetical protein
MRHDREARAYGGNLPSAVWATQHLMFEDAAEVQLRSCRCTSGTPSREAASRQTVTLCRLGRVARPCGVDRRSQDGGRSAYRETLPCRRPPAAIDLGVSSQEYFICYARVGTTG